MKRLFLLLTLFTLFAVAQPTAAAEPDMAPDTVAFSDAGRLLRSRQMPIIDSVDFRPLWDPYEDYVYWQLKVDVVLNNGDAQTVTFQNIRLQPDAWEYWPKPDNRQMRRFIRYSLATLSCNDHKRAAHLYDNPRTHNPATRVSIYNYAERITTIRGLRDWCQGDAPPLPPELTCPLSAPLIDDMEPDGDLFFYVYTELGNDSNHQLGFEFDGDRWEFAEFYSWGEAGLCQQQLDIFVDFIMRALVDPDCDPVAYSRDGRLLPPPEWFIEEMTQFCRNAAG